MHILKTSFRYTIYVFVNHEMRTLHHWRRRNMSNAKILETLNEPNSSSLYLKYILHVIDILCFTRYLLYAFYMSERSKCLVYCLALYVWCSGCHYSTTSFSKA